MSVRILSCAASLRVFVVAMSLAFMACAGVQSYPTGIRASRAPRFFEGLRTAASERGLQVVRQPDGLHIRVGDEGWVQFVLDGSEVSMVVAAEVEGLYREDLAARQDYLRSVGDELLLRARRLSR